MKTEGNWSTIDDWYKLKKGKALMTLCPIGVKTFSFCFEFYLFSILCSVGL
jgi:hypothetical protein